jgi:tRNA-dihydrouridine synthase A
MTPRPLDRRLCVAPMMDYTDRHCRYLLRLLSPHALLYTEMVTAQALAHGDVERLLGFDDSEHPVALQVGGSDPALLAQAARLGEARGYDEINLNVGCPSDRVQSGRFGACLMAEPRLVAECVRSMREAVARVPVTVKCRIGIDDHDSYDFFAGFVDTVAREGGVDVFIVHARKAHLQGLSPKENREIPPLRYDVAARLKAERPDLTVILNGGLKTAGQVREWLPRFDGVMLGRQAYQEPYLLAQLERELIDPAFEPPPREAVAKRYARYVAQRLRAGDRLPLLLRHVQGLYAGRPNARNWRRYLTEQGQRAGADERVLLDSLRMFA